MDDQAIDRALHVAGRALLRRHTGLAGRLVSGPGRASRPAPDRTAPMLAQIARRRIHWIDDGDDAPPLEPDTTARSTADHWPPADPISKTAGPLAMADSLRARPAERLQAAGATVPEPAAAVADVEPSPIEPTRTAGPVAWPIPAGAPDAAVVGRGGPVDGAHDRAAIVPVAREPGRQSVDALAGGSAPAIRMAARPHDMDDRDEAGPPARWLRTRPGASVHPARPTRLPAAASSSAAHVPEPRQPHPSRPSATGSGLLAAVWRPTSAPMDRKLMPIEPAAAVASARRAPALAGEWDQPGAPLALPVASSHSPIERAAPPGVTAPQVSAMIERALEDLLHELAIDGERRGTTSWR